MTFPSLALQAGVYTALNASADLGLVEGGTIRIYDRVPPNPIFPYITIGDELIVDDSNTCESDAVISYVDVHIWSRTIGRIEAKEIAGAVHTALNTEIAVTGFRNVVGSFENSRVFMDPDGLTTHIVMSFRYMLEPA